MRVVVTHTDLRIYWPARIAALQQSLESRGDELYTVEIAGAGSPYSFALSSHTSPICPRTPPPKNWTCLFPSTRMEDIPPARASRELYRRLDDLAPDIVMSGSIAYPSGATAVYWAKANRRPVIMFDDARPQDVPRNPLVNYLKKLIYSQVDAVLCPALPWADALAHWNFKVEQIFFGVDVVDNAFWATTPQPGPPPVDSPFLLAVGRQIRIKNFPFLLRAYERYRLVVGETRALSLVLIGEGPERETLENFVRTTGVKGVHLLPFASPEQLRLFYHSAAALVLPSLSETWGLVVNEAMAAGLPVLVSNTCGCSPVLVRDGINGYTFSPDRVDELLEALIHFDQKDAAAKAKMSAASRRIIRPWGLDQFVRGSLRAIHYAMENKKTCRSMPARLALKTWKGRYRPV